jgi:hypothetical protein
MTERAQRIMEAYRAEDTYNFPNDGVAAALREVVNQLENTYEIKTGIHRTGMIFCADVLELCEELETL